MRGRWRKCGINSSLWINHGRGGVVAAAGRLSRRDGTGRDGAKVAGGGRGQRSGRGFGRAGCGTGELEVFGRAGGSPRIESVGFGGLS